MVYVPKSLETLFDNIVGWGVVFLPILSAYPLGLGCPKCDGQQ